MDLSSKKVQIATDFTARTFTTEITENTEKTLNHRFHGHVIPVKTGIQSYSF